MGGGGEKGEKWKKVGWRGGGGGGAGEKHKHTHTHTHTNASIHTGMCACTHRYLHTHTCSVYMHQMLEHLANRILHSLTQPSSPSKSVFPPFKVE